MLLFIYGIIVGAHAQEDMLASPFYKHVKITTEGFGDYTDAVILLHESYTGTDLKASNFVVGQLQSSRGDQISLNRINNLSITSRTSYNKNYASIESQTSDKQWSLVTCDYLGKSYLALRVPQGDARLSGGFYFSGWTYSTGENLKFVIYRRKGVPENGDKLSNIKEFIPNLYQSSQFSQHTFTGSVGIGTVDPKAKLAVEGNILAKEIKVTNNIAVPDYVFEPSYQLNSLSEIEAYVKENKHLPEIPSAKEIEGNGLDLGEMNLLLLKKVEELTLHLIDKDREIQELKSLRKEVDQLRKLIINQK